MTETKIYKSYNYLTGDVENTFSYDVPEVIRRRPPVRTRPEEEWVREKTLERAIPAARSRREISLLAALGYLCAGVLLVLMLFSRIQMTALSDSAAKLEAQIKELDAQNDKLTMEYESVFNLAQVEDYAVNVLNMQKPREDQVQYLTGVSGEDRAVVLTPEKTKMFSLGLKDLVESLQAYFR